MSDNTTDSELTNIDTESEHIGKAEETEVEEKVSGEDNLETYTKNPFKRMKRDSLRVKRQMSEMSRTEKLRYIFYYYKWHALVTLGVLLFILYVANVIYRNSRPVALSYVVVNSWEIGDTFNSSVIDDYANYYDIKKGHKLISVNDLSLDIDKYTENPDYLMNSNAYMSFSTLGDEDYFDVIITDMSGLRVLIERSHLYPADMILSEDNLSACEGRLITLPSPDGTEYIYAVDISNLDPVNDFNLKYTDAYLCFPGHSEENIANANRFLSWLLDPGYCY